MPPTVCPKFLSRAAYTPAALLIMALTALAFAVAMLITPRVADDLWYMAALHDFKTGLAPFPGFGPLFDTIRWHYLNDNGRLCNVVFTLLTPLPSFVLALFSALACAFALFRLARFVDLARWTLMSAIWLCIAFTFALPWGDSIFILCFQFNYVWGIALAAFAAELFLSNRKPSPVLMAVVGLVSGAWHEGFSVPLACALAALMCLWPRRFFSLPRVAMLVGMIAGILWLVLAPSFLGRSNGFATILSASSWLRALRADWPIVVFTLLAIAYTIRRRALYPFITFCAVVALVSFAIYMNCELGPRVSFIGDYFSIAGTFRVLAGLFSKRRPPLAAIALILLTAHLAAMLYYTAVVRKETLQCYSRYYALSPGESLFTPITLPERASILALDRPFFDEYPAVWHAGMREWEPMHLRPFAPVPWALESFDVSHATSFPGHPGLLRFKGLWVVSEDSVGFASRIPVRRWGDVTFGTRTHSRFLILTPFTAPSDGKNYYWLQPTRITPYTHLLPITSITW